MEYRTNRIIGIILAVILLVIGILVVGPMISGLFKSDKASQTVIQADRKNLFNTEYGRAVRMSVRGPIVADEDFRSYDITVSANGRNITTYRGYLKNVTQTEDFDNNTAAYEQFVYALNRYKFVESKTLTGDANDSRGICPTGYLYEFELIDDNKSVKKLWTASCSRGSMKAEVGIIKGMFTKQIPKSSAVIGKLWQ